MAQIDPAQLNAEQQVVFDRIAGTRGRVAGPFTVLLHVPALADGVQQLGAYLRFETELPRDLAELAVLVTSKVWSCPFEWDAHEPIARRAGVPATVIEAAAEGDYSGMPQNFAAICRFTHQLAAGGRVSDETYGAVGGLMNRRSMVELAVLVGYYSLLAMTINAHEIPSPAPPRADGGPPPSASRA